MISDFILSDENIFSNKLVDVINAIFSRKVIPSPFCFSRLHLLKKTKDDTVPGMNDLRPIMISSPIIKVIEAIVLFELKEKI